MSGMVVKFDKATKGSNGKLANAGSSSAYVNYLGKEDAQHIERGEQPEQWFSFNRDECHPAEVRAAIDSDHQGIGKAEGKFATGSINITEEEWKALGKTEEERKENFKAWIQEDFSKEFAGNFNKQDKDGKPIEIEPDNVKMYYKLEENRHYKGTDEEVKRGEKQQGEAKEGFNVHCHFIVARKTADKQNRISPTTNNKKEFSRDELTQKLENGFDQRIGYERPLNQSYEYHKTMANGTGQEKAEMIQKTVAEDLHKTPKQEQTHTQEREHEQRKGQDYGYSM